MRRFLPGLCLACMLVMGGAAFAQKIVLSIDGNWWDSSGQALGFASTVNGPCVFGDRGSLEVADAGTKAAQIFVYDKMTPACPSSCPAPPPPPAPSPGARCRDARVPAARAVVEASFLPDLNLSKIFSLLIRRPQMYIVAAARGLEDEPLEAVLPIDGLEVDVSDALQPLPAATYLLTLNPVDGGKGGISGKVRWQPSERSKVKLPGIAPGLYRLTTAVEGGDSEGSQTWVLLSSPAHYQADAREFHQAVELTQSWGDQVEASGKRALLRATLQSAGDHDAGK